MNCLFLFVISFVSDIASLFLNLWENLLIKDLLTKKRVKYYSDKFASKTKLLNCLPPFEETSHCIERIGARVDTKCQNLNSFF